MNYYWSRIPGKFVNKLTGDHVGKGFTYFNGTVQEWYETLVETIVDLINNMHREYLLEAGFPPTIICSPDVKCILECSILFNGTTLECYEQGAVPVECFPYVTRNVIGVCSNGVRGTIKIMDMNDDA